MLTQELPPIKTIEEYSVGQLKEDFENNYLNKKEINPATSPIYHALLLVSLKLVKNKNYLYENISDEGDSGIRLGNLRVSNGCLTAVQIGLQRRLLEKTIDGKTTFGLAAIFDRYQELEMKISEPGGIGAALLTEIRNALIDEYRSTKHKNYFSVLKKKIIGLLDTEKFEFDGEVYTLKNPELCDLEEHYETVRRAVNSVEPWYGTDTVYKTESLVKILVLAFCVDRNPASIDEVFGHVGKKIYRWIANNPTSQNIMTSEGEVDVIEMFGESEVVNFDVESLDFESIVFKFYDSLEQKEINVLRFMFDLISLEKVEFLTGVKKRSVYYAQELLVEKIQKFIETEGLDMEGAEQFIPTLKQFLNAKIK